ALPQSVGAPPKRNIASFARAIRQVWLNAGCIAGVLIKFACIFIISSIPCSAIKSTRRGLQKISRAKCCMRGSLGFVIHALANGEVLRLRCLRILTKLSGLPACEYQCHHVGYSHNFPTLPPRHHDAGEHCLDNFAALISGYIAQTNDSVPGRERDGRRSTISVSTVRTSSGRTTLGQRNSSTPRPMAPSAKFNVCTNSRIVMAAVCQPLAINPLKIVRSALLRLR